MSAWKKTAAAMIKINQQAVGHLNFICHKLLLMVSCVFIISLSTATVI